MICNLQLKKENPLLHYLISTLDIQMIPPTRKKFPPANMTLASTLTRRSKTPIYLLLSSPSHSTVLINNNVLVASKLQKLGDK